MSTASALLLSMRPRQWTKNLLVFAPLVFSHELIEPGMLVSAMLTFLAFCLLSGSVYLMNDVLDIERDRLHAEKALRPVARGGLTASQATVAFGVACAAALAISLAVAPAVLYVALGYVALQVAYTLWLKHEVLLDVLAISAGFVLRAAAGAVAVGAALSPWLYSSVSLLALFLAFGKRRQELLVLGPEAVAHRPVLKKYTAPLLDVLLASATAATIVTYSMYSFSSATADTARGLSYTVPFVAYGLFRYLYLIYSRSLGGSPDEILLTDPPIIVAVTLWLAVSVIALYL